MGPERAIPRALQFLQTSQKKFRLVTVLKLPHVQTCVVTHTVFVGIGCRCEFPGLAPGKRVCGPSRLPDVKPPCSNLAGTLVPATFFSGQPAPGSLRGPGR